METFSALPLIPKKWALGTLLYNSICHNAKRVEMSEIFTSSRLTSLFGGERSVWLLQLKIQESSYIRSSYGHEPRRWSQLVITQ